MSTRSSTSQGCHHHKPSPTSVTSFLYSGHGFVDTIDICAITFLSIYGTILQMTWTLFEGNLLQLLSWYRITKYYSQKWNNLNFRNPSSFTLESLIFAKSRSLFINNDYNRMVLSSFTCHWVAYSCKFISLQQFEKAHYLIDSDKSARIRLMLCWRIWTTLLEWNTDRIRSKITSKHGQGLVQNFWVSLKFHKKIWTRSNRGWCVVDSFSLIFPHT